MRAAGILLHPTSLPGPYGIGDLGREADRFLAKRASVDGELVKPVDAGTLRRAAKRILEEAGVTSDV